MADTKISALTGATTPLAGSEVLPIVQGGATVKVSVDNLTTGKTVAGLNFKANSATALGQYTAKLVNTAGAQTMFAIENATSAGQLLSWTHNISTDEGVIGTDYGGPFSIKTQGVSRVTVAGTSGNTTLVSGNLIPGTAAKGINFTANTPAAGMTSQLLNWYEEGAWTPVVTAAVGSITTVGAVSGTYTRIGRQVTLGFKIEITVNGTGSNSILIAGIPFSPPAINLYAGVAYESVVTGALCSIYWSSVTELRMANYAGIYPATNGSTFTGTITYFV